MSKWIACSVAGCVRRARAHGLCEAHINRLRRIGSVQAERPVLLMNHRKTWGTLSQILRGKKHHGG